MTYRPRRAPGRKFYHASWKTGFLANSVQGSQYAKDHGYGWIDNDHHLTADHIWVNAHGAPEKTWGKGKFESRKWADLAKLRHTYKGKTYRLRTGGQTLADNAARKIGTEFEVKDLHPLTFNSTLEPAFVRLARAAAKAYGPKWRDRVVVKCLSDMSGGEAYALKVLAAAHKAGFTTILLARGSARYKTFAGFPQVTYVRGSRRI